MVRGWIKGCRQCYKSFVTRLKTGCDSYVVISLATNYV